MAYGPTNSEQTPISMASRLDNVIAPNAVSALQDRYNSQTIGHDDANIQDLESYGGQQKQQTKIKSFLYGSFGNRSRHLNISRESSLALSRTQQELRSLRLRAVRILFNLHPQDLAQWPGILMYCNHLEQYHFPVLLEPQFDIIWTTILGRERRPYLPDTSQGWHWCLIVIETFQSLHLGGDIDPSIETVYSALIEGAQARARGAENYVPDISPDQKHWALKAIFAALCWISATLTPMHMKQESPQLLSSHVSNNEQTTHARLPPRPGLYGVLIAQNAYKIYSSKDLRRPVSKLFHAFRNHTSNQRINVSSHLGGAGSNGQQSQQPLERTMPEFVDQRVENSFPSKSAATTIRQSANDVLYEASLNYFSLNTISRVKLVWVDTTTAHLAFNRSTRTLSLFKYPSLCAVQTLSAESGTEVPVISNIVNRLLPSQHYTDDEPQAGAVYREMLLSYRLLFGKSSKSRKLLASIVPPTKHEASSKRNHRMAQINRSAIRTSEVLPEFNDSPVDDDASVAGLGPTRTAAVGTALAKVPDLWDPLLLECTMPVTKTMSQNYYDKLASAFTVGGNPKSVGSNQKVLLVSGRIFPTSALDVNGNVQDFDTYSVENDFPIFGQRLLVLQAFNMRQQPSKVRDLWRDRRNPLQWYTFWAVLLVGGISILLAVLQLVVAIVQTVFGAPSSL
ncbi:hypothetical protein F4803DRAFT_545204 [Xylaria telfairii]|nr:hypothetical protein F4803DRAFT_545204 [Xylaria telfairii]